MSAATFTAAEPCAQHRLGLGDGHAHRVRANVDAQRAVCVDHRRA
jgi:hypothetical protein